MDGIKSLVALVVTSALRYKPQQPNMHVFLSVLLKRTIIGYLIVALCMASLLSAHVHLQEHHAGPEFHAHAMEIHFAHFEAGHDSFDSEALHTTDATAVDIENEVGTTNLYKILDVVAIVAAVLFLLAVPSCREYRIPLRATLHRSDPHYSPLQARAPPR